MTLINDFDLQLRRARVMTYTCKSSRSEVSQFKRYASMHHGYTSGNRNVYLKQL